MFESTLQLLLIGASGLAGGLGTYYVLSNGVHLMRWFIERRRPGWLRRMTRPTVRVQVTRRQGIARTVLLIVVVVLGIKALISGGMIIAVFLFAIGVALYIFLGTREGSVAREQVTDAVGELVASYYSAYLVIPTIFGALAEAIKTQVNPDLKDAVQGALDAFGAGKTTEEVLELLASQVQNPYLSQFAFILRHSSESNQTEILNTLRDLGNRLDQRKRLKDRSRVALALVSGTVRFLQAANGAVMGLAVLAPFWWGFYSSSAARQILFVIGGSIAMMGSWYFENQLIQLRERVL